MFLDSISLIRSWVRRVACFLENGWRLELGLICCTTWCYRTLNNTMVPSEVLCFGRPHCPTLSLQFVSSSSITSFSEVWFGGALSASNGPFNQKRSTLASRHESGPRFSEVHDHPRISRPGQITLPNPTCELTDSTSTQDPVLTSTLRVLRLSHEESTMTVSRDGASRPARPRLQHRVKEGWKIPHQPSRENRWAKEAPPKARPRIYPKCSNDADAYIIVAQSPPLAIERTASLDISGADGSHDHETFVTEDHRCDRVWSKRPRGTLALLRIQTWSR